MEIVESRPTCSNGSIEQVQATPSKGSNMSAKYRLNFSLLLLLGAWCMLAPQAVSGQTTTGQGASEQTASADDKPKTSENSSKNRKKDSERFMRIRKDAKGRSVALETSVTRYELVDEDNNRITVDLIGAVHIGEKEYFDALNHRFEQYESVLYELVAPEGTVIPHGGRAEEGISMNPIAAMQKGMKSILGLEFQLEHIDYTKKNFTHADMTPEEFAESMKSNDESLSKYAIRAIGQSMAMQSAGRGGDSVGMLMALFSNNKELRLRRSFAKQIQEMEAGMVIFEGKDGSTIIDHRNAKCMEVLEREIASGKRNLAIFYGAGHLADMERRLMSDFKMKRGGSTWIPAWSLTNRGKEDK